MPSSCRRSARSASRSSVTSVAESTHRSLGRRIRREQLVGALAAQVHLAARRAAGGDRAGHDVEVGAQPLVAPVALAEPPAEQLFAGGPRAPRLRRVEVDDDEVVDLAVRRPLRRGRR